MSKHHSFYTPFVLCWLILVGTVGAAAPLTSDEKAILSLRLPKLLYKLTIKEDIHVAFVGDAALLEVAGNEPLSMPRVFLEEWQDAFYYTGGVRSAYDEPAPAGMDPEITFESIAIHEPTCLNLVQHLSTLGLLNEPDVVVLCASPEDSRKGIALDTFVRTFGSMAQLCQSGGAELIVLGPRMATVGDPNEALAVGSRPFAAALRQWAIEQQIPYLDPNSALFPPWLLFHESDNSAALWEILEKECLLGAGGPSKRQLRALGKSLYRSLVSPKEVAYFSASTSFDPTAGLRAQLTYTGSKATTGFVFPCFGSTRSPAAMARPIDLVPSGSQALDFGELASDSPSLVRGQVPGSLLVVHRLGLQWIDVRPAKFRAGVRWLDHAVHNNLGKVPVRCEVYPNEPTLSSLSYEVSMGTESTMGTLNFSGGKPARIEWAADLGNRSKRVASTEIILRLGQGQLAETHRRRIDAIRQIPLVEKVPMIHEGAAPDSDEVLGSPSLKFSSDASAEDISFHFDFRNIAFAEDGDEPAVTLSLTLDARPYTKRQSLGYVGVLDVTAGPKDGPAKFSPFSLAHFGDGYTRIPLAPGTQAQLSSRPNGDRRLTVNMRRKYFEQHHPWDLGNPNSQLGISAVVNVRSPSLSQPVIYRLHQSTAPSNSAEGLAILVLTSEGRNRWNLKFSDL